MWMLTSCYFLTTDGATCRKVLNFNCVNVCKCMLGCGVYGQEVGLSLENIGEIK